MTKEKCEECKFKYSGEILSMGICGICALEMTNKIHGIERTEFSGEMAEQFRQEAIEQRDK